MRKYIDGRLVEMTPEEVEEMLAAQLQLVRQIPLEDRLEKLETAFSKLAPLLENLIPGISGLWGQKQE